MISLLPETGQTRRDLLGSEFGDGVERGRIAGRLFIEQHVPECARAVGCRGRQIDDASNAAASRRDQDRRLSQQVYPQNGLGIARLALRSGGDRGSQNDGVITGGDHRFHGLTIRDIALDSRQPIAVRGKILPCVRRQARAVEQCHRMTARQQCRGDIEPDETGAAEDKDSHRSIRTLAADGSQQGRAEILLGIHVRHQAPGRFRRLASRARQETARCLLRPNVCRPPR